MSIASVTLFRIVQNDPPSAFDMMSHQQRGRTMRVMTARARRLWSGLSVYQTREQAVAQVVRFPMLGEYIAELRVPLDGSIKVELDNGPRGHCTIWGDMAVIRACIASVTPAGRSTLQP